MTFKVKLGPKGESFDLFPEKGVFRDPKRSFYVPPWPRIAGVKMVSDLSQNL